jgi:hypothetical protein
VFAAIRKIWFPASAPPEGVQIYASEFNIFVAIVVTILFGLIGLVIYSAVSMLMGRGASPAQKGPLAATLHQFSLPSAEEGRTIPELFGRRLVAPNCLAYGDLVSEKIITKVKSGKKTSSMHTGWKYNLTMVWGFCGVSDRLIEFRKAEEVQFTGDISGIRTSFSAQTGSVATLQGSKTGPSNIDYYDGRQVDPSDYIRGEKDLSGEKYLHSGITILDMRGVFVGDNTTSVQPYSAVLERLVEELYPWAESINGECNPAGVIYYILAKMCRVPTGMLDLAAFQAAADTLKDEGLGISFLMQTKRGVDSWLQEIHEHLDSVLYYDEITGKFVYKLIRGDYVIDDLPVLNEYRYKDLILSREGMESVFTDAEFQYVARNTWKVRPYVVVNNANRKLLRQIKKKVVEFGMFTQAAPVENAIARFKRKLFVPLATAKFKASLLDIRLHPGDVFLLNNDRGRFEGMVMRVVSVGGGDGKNHDYDVQAVEDMFGLGNVEITTIPGDGGTPPNYTLTALIDFAVVDAIPENSEDGTPMVVAVAAPNNLEVTVGASVYSGNGSFEQSVLEEEIAMSGVGSLEDDYTAGGVRGSSFVVESARHYREVDNDEIQWLQGKTLLVLDGRSSQADPKYYTILSIGKITNLGSGRYQVEDMLLVWPQYTAQVPVHLAGDPAWLVPFSIGSTDSFSIPSAALNVFFQPFNTQKVGPESSISYTYNFGVETPYAVTRLEGLRTGPDVTLTWEACEVRRGPIMTDPDLFPAIDQTPSATLTWHVTSLGGVDVVVSSPTATILSATPSDTYFVSQIINYREGKSQSILVV